MIAFANRNLKLYLRDKASVLFSLLSVFIVIGLYVVFLGDVWTQDLEEFSNARELMDNWVMAGVLAITSVTTTMGILSNMVRDKENNIYKDFYVSPIKRGQLIGGYIISAIVVGLVMSCIAFLVAEGYIVANGGNMVTVVNFLKVLVLLVLTTFMNTTIMFLFVSFFQTTNAFATASTVIGTLIGFITGIYLPIGMYPEGVQWIIKICPVSHAALLFRQVMMEDAMNTAFQGVPTSAVYEVKTQLGIIYEFGTHTVSFRQSLLVILISGVVCSILSFLIHRKRRNAS
ncbi:MAG: ABC transporter permease [Velocimicrobium sp.]